MKINSIKWFAIVIIFLISTAGVNAQGFQSIQNNITDFKLDNGLMFIVLERHDAPVVSFFIYVDVGSANEVKGITGISHIFEHMAFKGTKTIGTTDYTTEQKAIDREEQLYASVLAERDKGALADSTELRRSETEFQQAQEASRNYVKSGQYESIIELNGGVRLNAGTSSDATVFYYSLPSNKTELWFSLESDRFMNFVLREFYQELDVIKEERRLNVENNPIGKLVEEFTAIAFKAHPYGEPIIGHMSDITHITRKQAQEYFERYYAPSNMCVAVVGDVSLSQIKEWARIYFGRIPSKPKPSSYAPVEPPQNGLRRVSVEDNSQPLLLIGYHRPGINHPDNAVCEALADILAGGRSSRLYKSLVKEKKIAAVVQIINGFPGSKYPNLFVFFVVPTPEHTTAECETAVQAEIERIKNELVPAEELEGVKTRAKAGFIEKLRTDSGMAESLASAYILLGDWRNVFTTVDKINKIIPQDIQRIATNMFVTPNMVIGEIVKIEKQ